MRLKKEVAIKTNIIFVVVFVTVLSPIQKQKVELCYISDNYTNAITFCIGK